MSPMKIFNLSEREKKNSIKQTNKQVNKQTKKNNKKKTTTTKQQPLKWLEHDQIST